MYVGMKVWKFSILLLVKEVLNLSPILVREMQKLKRNMTLKVLIRNSKKLKMKKRRMKRMKKQMKKGRIPARRMERYPRRKKMEVRPVYRMHGSYE